MSRLEVAALNVYPVKSMKGIALERAVLTRQGLAHDRRFMVVRADGQFVSQRQLPRLALIRTALDADEIVLALEGEGSVRLPLHGGEGQPLGVRIWQDECEAVDQGDEFSRWLTAVLQSRERLRLVQMAPGFVRPQSKPGHLGTETHTRFADLAPYLVASQDSLGALNAALLARGHQAVPMNRFRPNVVLHGLGPFEEHEVCEVTADAYALRFCHPCQRCIVTTINQDNALRERGWQPYKTLAEINPMPGKENAPAFGQNAILLRGEGAVISVGDRLSLAGACEQPAD